ncbi:LPXTG cell wall anchor domain-containing protein [Micromonospora sp. BQ11]|uniref:LPXTG cell wall anchor domain-containing protein n=1 Tax=Micromonospora sp. BQ11 TaxID=3452212 RepID=UPI003F8C8F70
MPQRRRVVRAAVSTAAAAACLTLATPAWASSTVPLHTAHKGSTAAGFQQECGDERMANRPADHDGWHFVLPTKEGGNFETLTLTFSDGSTTVTVKVPDATDAYPDAFYSTGGKNPQVKHAYVFTPAGWKLVDGTATVSGTAAKFNLSHTCAGTGTPGTPGTPTPGTPTPTTPAPTTPGTPGDSESPSTPGGSGTPTPGGGGGGEDDGGLPVTGVAGTSIALTGLALIGGGVALTVLRRRRDSITFTS